MATWIFSRHPTVYFGNGFYTLSLKIEEKQQMSEIFFIFHKRPQDIMDGHTNNNNHNNKKR